jgi:predicted ATPase/class 3 adenylate cyclase
MGAMRELPSGTVTFLFTDIEGSTRLLHDLGERAYAEALAEHRRVLREAFARHGGVEVDTQGDAFFVAFPTALGALAAAADSTELLALGPISVRIGLHTGTPLLTREGYVGADVHRAARIAASGHGGQVLVSAATAGLVDLASLQDLGHHRFKDLAAPERVYQLGDGEFPPLKSLYQTNLPVPPTPFLGRARELADVVDLLTRDDVRLLTLTGPGGTGKTRLALQAAGETAQEFPDGIWWVPLAPLRAAALVLPTVAQTLGLRERAGITLEDILSSALSNSRALLLLDNCEHLLPDVAGSVGVLRDAGGSTVLVTSRERLRVRGEQAWAVPTLNEEDGAALFAARARSVDPTFTPTPVVDELCTRLDQLPLAVELAAARTSLFTPSQLLERLGQRLDLLTGDRDADPRQRTLRATIDWSYDLLTDEEQDLCQGLSVFAGGSTYEAAQQVGGATPDGLQSLIDKSLLRRRDAELGPRYWMLETVREFAAERLGSKKNDDARHRHATWYASLAVRLSQAVRNNEPTARAALAAELGNFRGALAWSLSRGDARSSGDCLFGLWFYWLTEGLGREAATAADAWLALDRAELAEVERLPGLIASGEILGSTGDLKRAADLKYETLAISRSHADESFHGREVRRIIPATLTDLARVELSLGNLALSRTLAEEGLALRRQEGNGYGIGHALIPLGRIALIEGDAFGARAFFSECLELLDGTPDLGEALTLAVESDLLLGNLEAAANGLRMCVARLRAARDVRDLADAARVASMLALEQGDPTTSAVLTGAFMEIVEVAGLPLAHDALWQRSHEAMDKRLGALLGQDELGLERTRGAQLTMDEVLDLAADVALERAP